MSIKQKNKYGNNTSNYQDNSSHVNYITTNVNVGTNKHKTTSDNDIMTMIILGIAVFALYTIFLPQGFDLFKKYATYQYIVIIILSLFATLSIWFHSKQTKPTVIALIQSLLPLIFRYQFQEIQLPQKVIDFSNLIKQDGIGAFTNNLQGQFSTIFYILAISLSLAFLLLLIVFNFYRATFKHTLLDLWTMITPTIIITAFLLFGKSLIELNIFN